MGGAGGTLLAEGGDWDGKTGEGNSTGEDWRHFSSSLLLETSQSLGKPVTVNPWDSTMVVSALCSVLGVWLCACV